MTPEVEYADAVRSYAGGACHGAGIRKAPDPREFKREAGRSTTHGYATLN